MEWCASEGRAICTRNAPDFEKEHEKYLGRGEVHFGIVNVGEWTTEQTFIALKILLGSKEDTDLLNQIVALAQP
jgi:hypothetical protein